MQSRHAYGSRPGSLRAPDARLRGRGRAPARRLSQRPARAGRGSRPLGRRGACARWGVAQSPFGMIPSEMAISQRTARATKVTIKTKPPISTRRSVDLKISTRLFTPRCDTYPANLPHPRQGGGSGAPTGHRWRTMTANRFQCGLAPRPTCTTSRALYRRLSQAIPSRSASSRCGSYRGPPWFL